MVENFLYMVAGPYFYCVFLCFLDFFFVLDEHSALSSSIFNSAQVPRTGQAYKSLLKIVFQELETSHENEWNEQRRPKRAAMDWKYFFNVWQ